jgi:hypothetical protein
MNSTRRLDGGFLCGGLRGPAGPSRRAEVLTKGEAAATAGLRL